MPSSSAISRFLDWNPMSWRHAFSPPGCVSPPAPRRGLSDQPPTGRPAVDLLGSAAQLQPPLTKGFSGTLAAASANSGERLFSRRAASASTSRMRASKRPKSVEIAYVGRKPSVVTSSSTTW
jgi:hypothetical protein